MLSRAPHRAWTGIGSTGWGSSCGSILFQEHRLGFCLRFYPVPGTQAGVLPAALFCTGNTGWCFFGSIQFRWQRLEFCIWFYSSSTHSTSRFSFCLFRFVPFCGPIKVVLLPATASYTMVLHIGTPCDETVVHKLMINTANDCTRTIPPAFKS